MSDPIPTQIFLQGDTQANWETVNPVLPITTEGVAVAVEYDTGNMKVADGVTHYNDLGYTSDPAIQQAVAALQSAGFAPLDSPVFVGNPQGPTPRAGDYDTSFATTQFVIDAINLALQNPNTGVPTNSSVPVITLATTTAVCAPGTWTRTPTSYAYQWQSSPNVDGSGWTNITVVGSGFNTSTYTIQAGDVGKVLLCVVTASNANGAGAPATSRPTAPIQGTTAPPVNTVVPVVTGSAIQGQTLTTSDGTWTGSPTLTYQWAQLPPGGSGAGTHITGAISNTYVLQASDVGQTIYSIVTGTNAGGFDIGYSATTGAVIASGTGPGNTVAPTVTGTPTQGQTLTAHNGSWTGSPTGYTYQWQTLPPGTTGAGTNISGATASTFALTAGQVGSAVRVNVTATNASGSTTVSSAATAAIASGGGGTLIWDGTYSGVTIGQPPSRSNYPYQSVVDTHVTVQTDPGDGLHAPTGVKVARYAIPDSDRPYAENYAARADFASPNVYAAGGITYTSIPILCKHTDLPVFGLTRYAPTGFFQWAEAKDTAAGAWGFSMNLAGSGGVNHWYMGCNFVYYWNGPAFDNHWHTVTIRQLAHTSNGWIEMWWDGNPVTFNLGSANGLTRISGIKTITDGASSWPLDINMYRAINMYSGTLTIYHGPAKVGPDSGGIPATESGNAWGP